MATKTIKGRTNFTARLFNQVVPWFEGIFKTRNTGLQIIGNAFPKIYALTMKELRGYFTEEELNSIIKIMEFKGFNRYYDPTKIGSDIRENLIKEDLDTLLEKYEKLTVCQQACLEIWAISIQDKRAKKPQIDKLL